jgi:hypothetical protein
MRGVLPPRLDSQPILSIQHLSGSDWHVKIETIRNGNPNICCLRAAFSGCRSPKHIADFAVAGTPVNEALVHDLAGGQFIAEQRNCVLVGGIGKTHLAIAVARARGGNIERRLGVKILQAD